MKPKTLGHPVSDEDLRITAKKFKCTNIFIILRSIDHPTPFQTIILSYYLEKDRMVLNMYFLSRFSVRVAG